jgi:hypothetical protein
LSFVSLAIQALFSSPAEQTVLCEVSCRGGSSAAATTTDFSTVSVQQSMDEGSLSPIAVYLFCGSLYRLMRSKSKKLMNTRTQKCQTNKQAPCLINAQSGILF